MSSLIRRSPEVSPEVTGEQPLYRFKALVDADYIIYAAGLAGQYTIKHIIPVGEGKKSRPLASFRYMNDLKDWHEKTGLSLDKDVYYRIEEYLEPLPNVLHIVKVMLKELSSLFAGGIELYLTGTDNFREDVAVEVPYKGNRWSLDQREEARKQNKWLQWLADTDNNWSAPVRPKHKKAIIDYMCSHWGATIVNGIEADDKVSILQYTDWKTTPEVLREYELHTCIVHVDKDLNMVPGWHYNPTKEDLYYIDELDGYKNFYKQLLTGDKDDNIPGLYGIGPAKASKVIDHLTSIEDMYSAVHNMYYDHKDFIKWTREEIDKVIQNRSILLWMLREEGL